MKKVTIILASLLASVTFAQETEAPKSTPLEISGSGDLYYKYDFSGNVDPNKKVGNINTSFATDQNSVSLGMIDVVLKKKTGKASFVGELSFGPRGAGQSILDAGDNGQSFHIQNLYAAYAVSDEFTLTAGYMGTFIGYEVISPLANFHYSTSYLFTNGPFQNAGVKGTYAFSSKVSLMAGLFNDGWNKYQADADLGLNNFGAQLALTPVEGLSAYINFLDGSASGTIIDLTAAYQITEKFKLGLNVADYSGVADDTGYTGFALYPSYAVNKNFSLGLRAENFKAKENSPVSNTNGVGNLLGDESVTAFTLSANLKSGGLTFIPEIRMDSGSKNMFSDSDMMATKSATQATLSVVYGF